MTTFRCITYKKLSTSQFIIFNWTAVAVVYKLILIDFLHCFLFFTLSRIQEIQNKLTQREQELAERAKAAETGSEHDNGPASNDSNQNLDAIHMSALTNLLVVVGFALFAWTVTYVVSTLSEEEG